MKRTLSRLAFAVLTVGLLGSCSKINERLDSLEGRIDGIQNETVKTIDGQISSINSSIADLGTIRSNIQTLKSNTEAQSSQIGDLQQSGTELGKKIETLKAADEAIGERIGNLQKYVNDTLKAYATSEWVNATFSTLAQYEATCDTIAKIDARIGALDTRLSKSIEDCADSLKAWVNVQLGGYYTAAQMDATVAELQAAIDTASAVAAAAADSLSAELSATKAAIDTAKAAIRAEYRAAIDTAIKTSEGKLTKALTDAITEVNGKIESLVTRVDNLATEVDKLTGRVKALEGMIQSVVIVPAYSDGSVKVEDDTLYLDCIISPASTVSSLTKDNFTVLVNKVLTKSVNIETISIAKDQWFIKNAQNGTVSIKVPVNGYIPENADSTITVAVKVNYVHSANLASDYTTEFVPVTVYIKPIPVGFVDLGVKNAAGKPLYWAKCNLGADNPQDPGDYYMWGATALMYSAIDDNGAFTFVTENPYGDNYKNTWDASLGFNFNNVPFADGVFKNNEGERNVFTKYTTIDKYAKSGTPDNITTLKSEDDAATAKNASWRMPKYDEFVALAKSCVLVWTTDYNDLGKAGYIVYKAKNDSDKGKANMNGTWKMWDAANSKYITNTGSEPTGYSTSDIHIFLPAAGYGNDTTLLSKNTAGAYCSSDLNKTNNQSVGAVNFNKSVFNIAYNYFRSYGFSIRPVTE